MNSQILSNSIADYLKRGGKINSIKEKRRIRKLYPKKPFMIEKKELVVVKRILFMGKLFLRRYKIKCST